MDYDEADATGSERADVRRYANAAAFLERAGDWLHEREAEHNLILSIAGDLRAGRQRYPEPAYLAVAERGGGIVGCAFRTPPFKAGLTRMPADAAEAVARDMRGVYATLPAVLGPEPAAAAFAAEWHRLTGAASRVALRSRIYALTRVADGLPAVPGSLRTATRGDLDVVVRWAAAFSADTGTPNAMAGDAARRRLASGGIVLWDVDGVAVSMAAAVGPTRHGIRIGYVYTPPERRGVGYATACVAALSRRLLDAGRGFCVLYTDLANPTSNAIYVRIGYRPVADVVDLAFDVK